MAESQNVDVNWRIEPAEEQPGNDANRFDTWRQTETLGPYPEVPATGPPETGRDAVEGS